MGMEIKKQETHDVLWLLESFQRENQMKKYLNVVCMNTLKLDQVIANIWSAFDVVYYSN